MQSQNTSEVVATCVPVGREFQAAAFATPAGSSASEDDAGQSGGLSSTAHEWQMVCRSEDSVSLAMMPAAYSYSVPALPNVAAAMASVIVRFVEYSRDMKRFVEEKVQRGVSSNWFCSSSGFCSCSYYCFCFCSCSGYPRLT